MVEIKGKGNRQRKITVRLTEAEYMSLLKKVEMAVGSGASHYIRNVLFNKPVIVKYRNQSLDAFMEELILLRHELNAIGKNFNQAVKRLHSLKVVPEFRSWIGANESLKDNINSRIGFIQTRIDQMSKQWLQE